MKPFKAIAAMSSNRAIGFQGSIPWHLPEDFRWFKRTTTGHILVMGRKTYESIGRPLPNRTTYVLTRSSASWAGVYSIPSLEMLPQDDPREIFICGGAEIYRLALPRCSDLYLTQVKRETPGDAFFPAFEESFELRETILDTPDFRISHFVRVH